MNTNVRNEDKQLACHYIQESMQCAANDYELHNQAKKLLKLTKIVQFFE